MTFKYRGGERKVEDVYRKSRESSSAYDSYLKAGVTRFKPREGENQVRIMPGTWSDVDKYGTGWDITVHMHRGVGPDGATYLCLNKMKGKKCPVCDARGDMDEDEASEVRLQKRPFCYVIDRTNEKAGPQVWDMPYGLFRDINLRSVERKTNAVIQIDNPKRGFDVLFTREGTDLKTKYTAVEVERDPTPLHENERRMQRWIDQIVDAPLPTVLNFYDPDHIEKTLLGQAKKRRSDDDDEDEDDEEETTSRRRRKPAGSSKKRRRPADDDEDEDDEEQSSDEDDEDDEEEEEEEQPRRKRRRSRDEDEDEEDEGSGDEDEEDEEDDKPARRKRRRRPADEDEDDEDEEQSGEDEEDEEDEPPRRKRRRSRDEDEDEDEEAGSDDDDDEEEEDEPPRRRRSASKQAKRKLGKLKKRSSK